MICTHEEGCFYHLDGNFQIFLRVAEETGVDAESEQPAVSANEQGSPAGQRTTERQDDEDAGTQTHEFTTQCGENIDEFLHMLSVFTSKCCIFFFKCCQERKRDVKKVFSRPFIRENKPIVLKHCSNCYPKTGYTFYLRTFILEHICASLYKSK